MMLLTSTSPRRENKFPQGEIFHLFLDIKNFGHLPDVHISDPLLLGMRIRKRAEDDSKDWLDSK